MNVRWTRSGVVLLGLLGVLGVTAEWSPWPGTGIAWRILVLVMLVAVAVEAARVRRLRFSAEPVGPRLLPLGQPVAVAFEFRPELPLSLPFEYRPDAPASLEADETIRSGRMVPGQPVRLAITLRPRALGAGTWTRIPLRIRGPLGVLWWHRDLELRFNFRVVPDAAIRPPTLQAVAGTGSRMRPGSGPGTELLQLRDYQPGDSRRLIDWKATARSRRLTVRQFNLDEHREVMVLVDAGRTSARTLAGLPRLGHFANVAARLVEAAARQDDHLGLLVYAGGVRLQLAPRRAATARARLHQVLADLRSEPEESSPLAAVLALRQLVGHRVLLVILTDLQDSGATEQLVSALALVRPKHRVLVVDLADLDLAGLAAAEASGPEDALAAIAARDHLAAVATSMGRLVRLGAQAVQVEPSKAATVVTQAYQRLSATSHG